MNKSFVQYAEKINALSLRERLLVFVSFIVLVIFLWWTFYASNMISSIEVKGQQNASLQQDINTLSTTIAAIEKRLQQGVHKAKQQQLYELAEELDQLNQLLSEKSQELIEPNEMFELMQELLYAESKIKLTGLKRKKVMPVFADEPESDQESGIYRHVMSMNFQGKFNDILNYIMRLEDIDRELIWDKISLKTDEYPLIAVEIEISTLSQNRNWVGL